MALRLLSAAVALPLLLAVVWFGDPWLTALGLLITLAAVREFVRLAQSAGARTQGALPYLASAVLLLADRSHDVTLILFGLTAALAGSLAWAVFTWDGQPGDTSWLWTIGAVLYLPLLLSHYLWLREWPNGAAWVFIALAGTFSTDTGAYLVGRAVGRHRLIPRISPSKTWEGAVGGLAGGAVGTLGVAAAFDLPLGIATVGLGLGVSLAAQIGDLAESYLKRSARVKDAGGLIPGHGGLLDRLDSLVFAGPFVYYYVVWVMGAGTR
ncbi:MAG: phosphatidate cytidylyltransferase [Chloroflexi bacterium]|nr:phosphatidate cytidylyltransferase [Chloroflexota bacterium]